MKMDIQECCGGDSGSGSGRSSNAKGEFPSNKGKLWEEEQDGGRDMDELLAEDEVSHYTVHYNPSDISG
ncbi:hypothetical protein Dsin_025550 [Dipteronia sinensis]|uniref:Uncharacterized protein n=1 Tax=Dipteronia sinensis TaxID=43782 RepID=A0AAD9ZVV5_9ROSI|nr:hypothetical protein Dsin_025550 [Dipteronia sinensis]